MALVKGVHERVHLPLYDSLFVRPARPLRAQVTSNVLKFFVDIQGKTKLETNMQAASLLPHWNTFEARALRVVISDLPAVVGDEIQNCRGESTGSGTEGREIARCLDAARAFFETCQFEISVEQLTAAKQSLDDLKHAASIAKEKSEDFETCLGMLRRFCDPEGIGQILELHRDLMSIRGQLSAALKPPRGKTSWDNVRQFLDKLESVDPIGEADYLLPLMGKSRKCIDSFVQLTDLAGRLKDNYLAEVEPLLDTVQRLVTTHPQRKEGLDRLKQSIGDAVVELATLKAQLGRTRSETNTNHSQVVGEKLRVPTDEQFFCNGSRMLAKLIYNSVTTFFVGEKVMIQMPTWFFPAGAGPYSDDGQTVTHGLPTPQATFRFAEPVFIDTQQNFRVEIEFPEARAVEELQSINGPFLIWVVLDGYMTRDVQ
jgi:hypothetical protein